MCVHSPEYTALTVSSNPLMVTRFPGKALCSASPSVVVGRLTVIDDCRGTNTELKLLKWK